MFDYFVAGGLFSLYVIGTAIYQGVSCCLLTKRINILKNKLRRRGFVYAQGELSTVEYYRWLYNIYYYYSILDNLRKTSVVVERLFENVDELMVVINEVARFNDRENLELSVQAIYDVLNAHITQCENKECGLSESHVDSKPCIDEDVTDDSEDSDADFQSIPIHANIVTLLLKVLNYKHK